MRRTGTQTVMLLFVITLLRPQCSSKQNCEAKPDLQTTLGARIETGERFSTVKTHLRSSPMPDASYVRVLVDVSDPLQCEWYITIRDKNSHVIQTFSNTDFSTTRYRWTSRVPGDTALLDLQPCADSSVPSAGYSVLISMPAKAPSPFYSALDPEHPRWAPLYSMGPADTPLGDFVGFMMASEHSPAGVLGTWTCSGVVIGRDLFLTNWHCGGIEQLGAMWTKEIVSNMLIDLSWDDDSLSREYNATEVLAVNEYLDYAIVRMQAINSTDPARPAILYGKIGPNSITIVHHPAALQKQISKNCAVVARDLESWRGKLNHTDFGHDCDTEAGSSGAPVFNSTGQVIGLHHRGYDYSPNCVSDGMNKATKLEYILEDLRLNHLELYRMLTIVK